jgi:hypothetical protein
MRSLRAMDISPTPQPRRRRLLLQTNQQISYLIDEDPFTDNHSLLEHVLKPSASNHGLSSNGENARPPSQHVSHVAKVMGGTIKSIPFSSTGAKRPSPTSSIKRHKAEKLLKEHGSPPNVRVTAGGRIVPTDFTPLGSPCMPFASMHRPNLPAPFQVSNQNVYMPIRSGTPAANGAVTYLPDGRIFQHIDGKWLPVPQNPRGDPALFMPPSNWPFQTLAPAATSHPRDMANNTLATGSQIHNNVVSDTVCLQDSQMTSMYPPSQQFMSAIQSQSVGAALPTSDLDARIQNLRDSYEWLRQAKIEFERREVKMSDILTPADRADVVAAKKKIVVDLDAIRKEIKGLEQHKNGVEIPHTAGLNDSTGGLLIPTYQPVDSMSQLKVHVVPTAPPTAPANVPAFDVTRNFEWPAVPVADALAGSAEIHQISPGSETGPSSRAPRRSHAIEIKDPKTHRPVTEFSPCCLNPASPSYEPGKPFPLTEGSPPAFVVPAPSPIDTPNPPPAELAKQHSWVFDNYENGGHRKDRGARGLSGYSDPQSRDGTVRPERGSHTPSQHLTNQTSQSSVTTSDFFPTDTHEHSFGKYMLRKSSGPAILSGGHPLTPQKTLSSDFISPISDTQQRPQAPPVSPVNLEDFRMSSSLQDIASNVPIDSNYERVSGALSQADVPSLDPKQYVDTSVQGPTAPSPTGQDVRTQFSGRSRLYLEGYIAGTDRAAPADNSVDYVEGYCEGLKKKAILKRPSGSCSTSTTSLKSESISHSTQKTPPNTADARSVISLVLSGSRHPENVRLVPSTAHLPVQEIFSQQRSEGTPGTSGCRHPNHIASSFPPDDRKIYSQFGHQHDTYASLERAISDVRIHKSPQENNVGWSMAPAPISHPYNNKDVTNSSGGSLRRERILSMPLSPYNNTSLNPYAGNRHELTARVSSVPQRSVFGEDKYGTPDSKLATSGHRPREWSRHSQMDGAMDDLAEMIAPVAPNAEGHFKPTSSSGNKHHQRTNGQHQASYHAHFSPDPVSPPTSPSKSNRSPKKMTSPKERLQQLARGIIRTTGPDCPERSRPDSPDRDPKKMGPEEKRRWKEDWRKKFTKLKREENEHIRKYKKENPL